MWNGIVPAILKFALNALVVLLLVALVTTAALACAGAFPPFGRQPLKPHGKLKIAEPGAAQRIRMPRP